MVFLLKVISFYICYTIVVSNIHVIEISFYYLFYVAEPSEATSTNHASFLQSRVEWRKRCSDTVPQNGDAGMLPGM